jgi:hydroxymethylbilane synthase
MIKKTLTIATRESPLALWQANWVKHKLEALYPELTIHLLGMTTQADRMPYVSLGEIGGKGLFVKELEEALLRKEADIAVHSIKDMPMELPESLIMPVICQREAATDAFVSNHYTGLDQLPTGAVVGTSSLRRQSQLLFLRPDLQIKKLRGNVNTRLSLLDKGEYDAIVLATAGLQRLQLGARIRSEFSVDQFVPAVGQGALTIECRAIDQDIKELILPLNHLPTQRAILAERAMCHQLGGGCRLPIAGYAYIKGEKMVLTGVVATVDGSVLLQATHEDTPENATILGIKVAHDLLMQGADKILKSL